MVLNRVPSTWTVTDGGMSYPGVHVLHTLFHCILSPLSHLAWLSLVSSLPHPTPHLLHTVLLQTVLHPLTVDVLSILSSTLQRLLDNYGNYLHVPSPKSPLPPVERDFMFSLFRGFLFAHPWSIFIYVTCGVHTVIDLFCIREPLIVHWVPHGAGSMCS